MYVFGEHSTNLPRKLVKKSYKYIHQVNFLIISFVIS